MTLLSDEKIQDHLDDLVGWERQGNKIRRSFDFSNFVEAVDFVNKIVEPAEEHNHHPDLEVSWGNVRVTLMTHDEGGLTEKDFVLANIINELYTEDHE